MIKIDNLSKSFGNNQVLKGISQEIELGSVVVIIGASGSGKTTLLRCLNRTEKPDSGQILLDGQPLDYQKPNSSQTVSGMVFQGFNLFPHLTVLQNLTIAPIKVKGIKPKIAEQTAKKLLEQFGLSDKAEAYPRHLSGGQQQRVAICRELAMNPKIILFDEPTSALDPEKVNELVDIICQLKDTGVTQFVVTHNIDFATSVADQIWFIKAGQIVAAGPPKQLIKQAQTDLNLKEYFEKVVAA